MWGSKNAFKQRQIMQLSRMSLIEVNKEISTTKTSTLFWGLGRQS